MPASPSTAPWAAGGAECLTRQLEPSIRYRRLELTFALALAMTVTFFRFNVVGRWLGRTRRSNVFWFLMWALPLLSLACSLAFVLVAAC